MTATREILDDVCKACAKMRLSKNSNHTTLNLNMIGDINLNHSVWTTHKSPTYHNMDAQDFDF